MDAATVCGCSAGRKREVVTQVLAAVLPDHDARVRADERRRVAEEIARAIEVHPMLIGRSEAATVARQHATTREEPT